MDARTLITTLESTGLTLRVDYPNPRTPTFSLLVGPYKLLTDDTKRAIVTYKEEMMLELLWPAILPHDLAHVRTVLDESVVRETKRETNLWTDGVVA